MLRLRRPICKSNSIYAMEVYNGRISNKTGMLLIY